MEEITIEAQVLILVWNHSETWPISTIGWHEGSEWILRSLPSAFPVANEHDRPRTNSFIVYCDKLNRCVNLMSENE